MLQPVSHVNPTASRDIQIPGVDVLWVRVRGRMNSVAPWHTRRVLAGLCHWLSNLASHR